VTRPIASTCSDWTWWVCGVGASTGANHKIVAWCCSAEVAVWCLIPCGAQLEREEIFAQRYEALKEELQNRKV